MRKPISSKLNYIRNVFCKQSVAAQNIEKEITLLKLPEIHLAPEEAKILQFLIHTQNISSIVEIGTHVGYSTIWMADALKSNSMIYTIEKDLYRTQIAQANFDKYNYSNIKLYQGDALDILPSLAEFAPFDMLFIDANKSKYLNYLDWGEKYIRPGGVIVADNVLLFGTLFEDEAIRPSTISNKMIENMRIFNERINDEEKFFTILVPTDEGLSISIKLKGK